MLLYVVFQSFVSVSQPVVHIPQVQLPIRKFVTSLAINNCPITGFEQWLVDLTLLFTFPASYDPWSCVIA